MKKLLKANFIKEVQVIVKCGIGKKSQWEVEMCLNFTHLNKECPKDSFASPRIDKLVDAMVVHELFNFIEALSGYNQIGIHPFDKKKNLVHHR